MNLRSGTFLELKTQEKKDTQRNREECSMAKTAEIKQMFTELKDTLSREFQELKDELKQFCQETEQDIRTIMEQTADLRQKLEKYACQRLKSYKAGKL